MLTDELREYTEEVHHASEKKMIIALKQIANYEDYIRMLNWLYGFYAPVQQLIRQYLTEDNFPDINRRSRAEYILWDIRESGLPVPEPEVCEQLPVIDSFHRALGAMYVLEGSTLGGRIIAGMICRSLDSTRCLSFFNGYGAETGHMWNTFKAYINQPFSTEERHEIISAAEDSFLTFKTWIERHELQPQL
jgi:heme oxygenase